MDFTLLTKCHCNLLDQLRKRFVVPLWLGCIFWIFPLTLSAQSLRIGVFRVDATPPIGAPVAYAPAVKILDSLSARGIVLLSDQEPIVLCVVDWLGIANEGLELWRQSLADAAGTSIDRVSVHAIHQHDGMRCDFTSERILANHGLGGLKFDNEFLKSTIHNVAKAVANAKINAQPVSHIGYGQAKVEKVASNRRILGPDGKVAVMRWSKSTDSLAIAAPEGLIDPWLKSLSFWNEEIPLAVMTYYATHPQSYYGKGEVTSEFVGIARAARENTLNDLPHIHFNGAGGNIAAGKYNDGSEEMRPILASRMENAMKKAWDNTQKTLVSRSDLRWKTKDVALPLGKHLKAKKLRAVLTSETDTLMQKLVAAKHLAWRERTKSGYTITLSYLQLGNIVLLHLPGELFIEYQLAAQKWRPDNHVCTAAYGEYGPGYIGTKIAYKQGGYETSKRASRVSPKVEKVLMGAIKELLTE